MEINEKLDQVVQFDGKVKVTYVAANGYQGVELVCALQQNPWIMWKRNGQDIDFTNTNGLSVRTYLLFDSNISSITLFCW